MRIILVFMLLWLCVAPLVVHAQEIVTEGSYTMGESETLLLGRERALLEAKRMAVEHAGTYVESYSKVNNFQLTEDEVKVLASGVMEVTILDEKKEFVGGGIQFRVKIRATVVPDKLSQMALKVKQRAIVDDYKRLETEYQRQAQEIALLRQQLAAAVSKTEKQEVAKKISDSERAFQLAQQYEQGYHYQLNNQYEQAITAYDKVLELEPRHVAALDNRGLAKLALGRYDSAIADFRQAVAIDARFVYGYYHRVLAYVGKGALNRDAELEKDFVKMREINPRIMSDLITDYTKMIQAAPQYADAYILRGFLYLYDGKSTINQALADFDRAIEIDPRHTMAYTLQALALLVNNQPDRALTAIDKLALVAPGSPEPHLLRSLIYQVNDPVAIFNQGTDRWPSEKEMMAAVMARALSEVNKALLIDPRNATAYGARGDIHAMMQLYDLAVADYSQEIELSPNNIPSIVRRAAAYAQMQNMAKALADFDSALALEPDSAVYEARARIYRARREPDKALADVEQALALAPNQTEYYLLRAQLYEDKADYAKALADYDQLLRMSPNFSEVYYYKSAIYEKTGQLDQAIAQLQIFIQETPPDHRLSSIAKLHLGTLIATRELR